MTLPFPRRVWDNVFTVQRPVSKSDWGWISETHMTCYSTFTRHTNHIREIFIYCPPTCIAPINKYTLKIV